MKPRPPPTPRALGYRLPAEWEPHAATWLSWPRPDGISFPDRYDAVLLAFAELVRALAPHEQVAINVHNDEFESVARQAIGPVTNVVYHRIPTNEPWCRDHGPTFLLRTHVAASASERIPRSSHVAASASERIPRSSHVAASASERTPQSSHVAASASERTPQSSDLAIVDWIYNAWGGKYPPYDADDAVPQRVAELLRVPVFRPGIVMEGGAFDVNGAGSLLTTEACLLNPNRNPQLSRQQLEQVLGDYLGVTQILWLGAGIAGDDTDGHIDDLARFVNPTTVVTVVEDDPQDENFAPLQDNLHRLRAFADDAGRPLRIVELPMPGRLEHRGQRLPASYANFYIANDVVLLPTFRASRSDTRARHCLQELFPTRRVLPIDSTNLIWGLGAVHCLTQQQPRV